MPSHLPRYTYITCVYRAQSSSHLQAPFPSLLPCCTQRVCPSGPAVSNVLPSASPSNPGTHVLMECSGAGSCDRGSGQVKDSSRETRYTTLSPPARPPAGPRNESTRCKCSKSHLSDSKPLLSFSFFLSFFHQCSCFAGWEGTACDRRRCPGTNQVCSGHGRCFAMRELARMDDALPLSDHQLPLAIDPGSPDPIHASYENLGTDISLESWDGTTLDATSTNNFSQIRRVNLLKRNMT